MCGIVGAVGLSSRLDAGREARALGALAHRGPDGSGSFTPPGDRGLWLGFRRLAILDLLPRANQPMVDEATGVALVFNGEVYDFVERRAELEARGHRFRTTGDTEVLLRGYLEWGDEVFARCNAMFAAAVFDPRRDGVLLARDRFGEKPLFVGRDDDGSWWFASEVAALVAVGAGRNRIDLVRALGFLGVGDVDAPTRTFVEGIEQVPSGSTVRLTERGLGPPTRWWDVGAVVDDATGRPRPTPEGIRAALDEAVRIRLRSDVEVGTSLSGGLDSSAVVASLRAVDPDRPLHAFTASFPGHQIDEWERAELVGRSHGLTMHRVEPTVDGFVTELDGLLAHQGAPIEGPTVYAQWCVMRAAREAGVTVLLDGQGADETWGGYPKHVGLAIADAVRRGRMGRALRLVRTWRQLGGLPPPVPIYAAGLALGGRGRRGGARLLSARGRRWLGPAFAGVEVDDPFDIGGAGAQGSLLARAAATDLGRVVLPRLLRYADRNSMAWSREVRLPFLDPAVATAGLSSGWADGIAAGWTKHALRCAMADRVPPVVLWRREKTAYETPTGEWLRHPGVRALLRDAEVVLHRAGLLRAPDVEGLDPWRVLSLGRLVVQLGLST